MQANSFCNETVTVKINSYPSRRKAIFIERIGWDELLDVIFNTVVGL
jgi:hypothetical protein